MKVYISADIEGVATITAWDEARKTHADYPPFRDQMNREVAAACEGAWAAGASEVWVQDAHASARNLDATALPHPTRLVRGWSGHPLSMVQALASDFDAVLMIGYHDRANSAGNPLAHTIHSGKLTHVRVNGTDASEFLLYAYASALRSVPVVFLSGDGAICAEVQATNPAIATVPVKRGVGGSTISLHPTEATDAIRSGVNQALLGDLSACALTLPDRFDLELRYVNHREAYRAGFYPGTERVDAHTIRFVTDEYYEALRMMLFTI